MLIFKKTCDACPEQYDAFDEAEPEKIVGYLRLRHGTFTVECPDTGGDLVFIERGLASDGCFRSAERDHYLTMAAGAIQTWLSRNRQEQLYRVE